MSGTEAWTEADSAAACAEGWDVFDADGEMQIQRDDEAEALPDDAAAMLLVGRAASSGSPLHQKAMRAISERERQRVAEVMRGS